MINPVKEYKNIENALEVVGFEINYPTRFVLKNISVISDRLLQLTFASVIVRKAKYNENELDISGVYSGAYPNDCYKGEFENEAIKGCEYWNGSAKSPKAYLAYWSDNNHEYSYSVYAPKGIDLKTMSNWQKNLK